MVENVYFRIILMNTLFSHIPDNRRRTHKFVDLQEMLRNLGAVATVSGSLYSSEYLSQHAEIFRTGS